MANQTSVGTATADISTSDKYNIADLRQRYSELSELDLQNIHSRLVAYAPFKRLVDLLFALFLFFFFLPLMIIISLLIFILDGRPIFFRQERTTYCMRKFKIFKFRTMVNEATQKGPLVTKYNDDRITNLGKWLRKVKADEIPQVINIILGDMSFVGPRPEVSKIIEQFPDEHKLLFSYLKAGLTDYASCHFEREEVILNQVEDPEKYYSEVIMPEKLNLQFKYLANISASVDFRLSTGTFSSVFVRRITSMINMFNPLTKKK